ncbi:hypothetical protein BDA96_09G170600, partial [Sorghum bicolor]
MPDGKALKGAWQLASVSGEWRRPHQCPPRRNPAPCPLLPPCAAGRADLRSRPALATPLKFREFVDSLLLLRGSSPLEKFELRVARAAIDVRHVRLWVSYAVQCKVQVLRLSFNGNTHAPFPPEDPPLASRRRTKLRPEDPPLASRHLTKLKLCGLVFNDNFLDFSNSPELQDLKIKNCSFKHAKKISSKSLWHLTRILAPNLASLGLEVTAGRTPALEQMPLLVKSYVVIYAVCKDCCSHSNYGDCGDESCRGCIRGDSASVILHGISQAKSLMLLAYTDKFIFRRDLKLCPTFSRLKSLSLNQNWCVPDEHPLACILEHSPVLEDLILCLYFELPKVNVEIKRRFNPKELPPTISSHLKHVVIICGQ